MIEEQTKRRILERLSSGITLCEKPFAVLAKEFNVKTPELLDFLSESIDNGITKRIGLVVNHHKVGYTANAMVVWDVPDQQVDEIGEWLGQQSKVTLCYQRPRRLPDWRYNLFTMIHGFDKNSVLGYIEELCQQETIGTLPKAILFSSKKFKQTGAKYSV